MSQQEGRRIWSEPARCVARQAAGGLVVWPMPDGGRVRSSPEEAREVAPSFIAAGAGRGGHAGRPPDTARKIRE